MSKYVQKPSDWVLHYFHRLQQNNFDCLVTVSGSKGFGKSTASIYLARRYNELFSYVCPHCGRTGYKNFYAMRGKGNSETEFYVPDYLLNDSANIRCNYEYELDMKTGEKHISEGCNKTFKWSQRKPVPWKAETFVAYDNPDIMSKVFGLPKYSPVVCLEGNSLIPIKLDSGIEQYRRIKTLVGRNDFQVLTYNSELDKFEYKKPTSCINNGHREDILEIELGNGKKIMCTSDHLLLTQRGYVEAKHLKESDSVKIFDGEIGKNNKLVARENRNTTTRKRYAGDRKRFIKFSTEYRKKNLVKCREREKTYRDNHKEKRLKYSLKYNFMRKKRDANYKARTYFAKTLNMVMKGRNYPSKNLKKYLGCSVQEYRNKIENNFKKGMTWDNYPLWNADHIIPLCKFDLTKESEIKKALHFSNVQPLWAKENFSKGGK